MPDTAIQIDEALATIGSAELVAGMEECPERSLETGLLFYIRARERGHSLMEGRTARQIIDEAQDRQLVIDEFRERCGG